MYSSIAHSCTNNTVVAGYHDSRRNTDTPYRSLWRYICSSNRYMPVYRFALFTGSFWSCHYRPVNRDIDCSYLARWYPNGSSRMYSIYIYNPPQDVASNPGSLVQVAEQAHPLVQRCPSPNPMREHRNNRTHEEVVVGGGATPHG